MTSSTRTTQRQIDPAAADALRGATKLAVATDTDDARLAATRSLAASLAAEYDLSVVLYDRSQETWMDHPHPSGVCDRSDLADRDRQHIADQMTEFDDAGVEVTAWIATVPSITEIVDVVMQAGVDAILLPDATEHPKLLDRLKSDSPADVVERIVNHNLDAPVPVLVDDGTTVRVETTAE